MQLCRTEECIASTKTNKNMFCTSDICRCPSVYVCGLLVGFEMHVWMLF